MTTKYKNGLFIFRRDLRIIDNNSLNQLSHICDKIYSIFIFTPEQVGSNNKYKSNNCVQFMIESLNDLFVEIKNNGGHLYTFYGNNLNVITDCIHSWNIDCIGFNSDITPYSKIRDDKIIQLCHKMNVFVCCTDDYYLHHPNLIKNKSGLPYQKFTPYYKTASKFDIQPLDNTTKISFTYKNNNISNQITLHLAMDKFTKINKHLWVHGGRTNGIKQIQIALKNIKHYEITHNTLSIQTSNLSAFIKFGCLSIREIYYTFKSHQSFIRQLYWRDFYAQILYHFPFVLGKSLKPKYDKIKWDNNKTWFNAWKNGKTGFPVVDAGMRQMNITGYMHNRARLIVSSFLIKILFIDWRIGEKYFANNLVDYDVANNNGNYQWVAGSGSDSQPYFRIFNPWLQSKEYDPNCEYIKEWIPELNSLEPNIIHNWYKTYLDYTHIKYPQPIVDFKQQKDKVLQLYSNALK